MIVRVGLENGIEGRSLAWALDHPGCFAYGSDGKSAVMSMAQAIPAYIAWMESHTINSWFNPAEIDIRLVDVFEVYSISEDYDRVDEGYEVNAWFLSDWKPLTEFDIERGLKLLEWTRADLLQLVGGLSTPELEQTRGVEKNSIHNVLRHIGTAEWWYLDRLGLSGGKECLPPATEQRLHSQRDRLRKILPDLAGVNKVVGIDGEFWSPRKLLRRTVWHEMDHIIHIQQLLDMD